MLVNSSPLTTTNNVSQSAWSMRNIAKIPNGLYSRIFELQIHVNYIRMHTLSLLLNGKLLHRFKTIHGPFSKTVAFGHRKIFGDLVFVTTMLTVTERCKDTEKNLELYLHRCWNIYCIFHSADTYRSEVKMYSYIVALCVSEGSMYLNGNITYFICSIFIMLIIITNPWIRLEHTLVEFKHFVQFQSKQNSHARHISEIVWNPMIFRCPLYILLGIYDTNHILDMTWWCDFFSIEIYCP